MPSGSNGPISVLSASREWSSLNPTLSGWMLNALAAMGFTSMTPVQASTIPLFMGFKDVVVEAVTGSGKTLSFLVPVVERILRLQTSTKRHHIASIIIAPTRELAVQIDKVLSTLLSFHPQSAAALEIEGEDSLDESLIAHKSAPKIISQLLISGKTSPKEDLEHFLNRSPNVLVATPGRLLELLSSPRVHCTQSSFEVLVLDEADRLLDLGFKDDLQKILGRLPKQRRTGLFSASVSEALDQIIRVGLRNPVRVSVKVKSSSGKHDQRTPTSLQIAYVITPASHKLPTLLRILYSLEPMPSKSIIYLSTCAAVDYFQYVIASLFTAYDIPAILIPLHGKHTPQVRQKNFNRFSEAIKPAVLLTTDVAARGLDIPQVDFVAQFDPPLDPKAFLHRCGRAGRAGRKGLAVIFLQPGREEDYVSFLGVRKIPIEPLQLPQISASLVEPEDATNKIRDLVQTDRALHEKAQRGFVSWVQSYRKHQARSIFQLTDLDWKDLGEAWGLLKMPRMPELKGWSGDLSLGVDFDFDNYKYRDNQREHQRIVFKEKGASNDKLNVKKPVDVTKRSWSETLDHKDEREKRRSKKKAKKEHEKWQLMTSDERQRQLELQGLIEKARAYQMEENEAFEGFSD